MPVTTHDGSHRRRLRRLSVRSGALGLTVLAALTVSCGSTPATEIAENEQTRPSNAATSTTTTSTATSTTAPSVVATPTAARTNRPFRITMSASVTGTNDASDVMEWETIVDIDPSTEYVYFGQRGEAELGDVNCREAVWADGVGFGRSYPLPGDPAFDPSGSPGEFADLISALPFSIEQLEALTGAEANADADGVALSAVLTDDALDALEVTLFNANALGGAEVELGTIDARANADGELRTVTVVYESENGEQLVIDATVSDLADTERVTSSDTIESTGWCASFWSDAAQAPIGFWFITAVLDGERIFDDEVDQTPALFVYPDDTVAGNTGCSEIVGTATVAESGASEFEVRIEGPSCPDEHLERERTVIAALNSGSVTIGHAGSLSVGVDGEAQVLLFAAG